MAPYCGRHEDHARPRPELTAVGSAVPSLILWPRRCLVSGGSLIALFGTLRHPLVSRLRLRALAGLLAWEPLP